MANSKLFYEALMIDSKMMYLTKYNDQGARLEYLRDKPDVVIDLYVAYRLKQLENLLKLAQYKMPWNLKKKTDCGRKNQGIDQGNVL